MAFKSQPGVAECSSNSFDFPTISAHVSIRGKVRFKASDANDMHTLPLVCKRRTVTSVVT